MVNHLVHSPSMIQTGFCETVADVMDAEAEGRRRDSSFKTTKSGRERVPIHVLPEAAPQNHDFDVSEFLRSSPNPVVGLGFWRCRDTPKSSSTPWTYSYEIPVL